MIHDQTVSIQKRTTQIPIMIWTSKNFGREKEFAFFLISSWCRFQFLTWFWFVFVLFFSYNYRCVHLVQSPRIHLYIAHRKAWARSSLQRTPPFRYHVDGNKQRPQPNYLHVQIQRVQNRFQEIIQRLTSES